MTIILTHRGFLVEVSRVAVEVVVESVTEFCFQNLGSLHTLPLLQGIIKFLSFCLPYVFAMVLLGAIFTINYLVFFQKDPL